MNILILDDQDVRHRVYRRMYAGHNVVSALTYEDFLKHLDADWDIVHLDHDLGEQENANFYVDGWGKRQYFNGIHAANAIMQHGKKPKCVIVHSLNFDGARAMLDVLSKCEGMEVKREPFGEVL